MSSNLWFAGCRQGDSWRVWQLHHNYAELLEGIGPRCHHPAGYRWGDRREHAAGRIVLALDTLLASGLTDESAANLCEPFADHVLSGLTDHWAMTAAEVVAWVQDRVLWDLESHMATSL